ncbi:proliferating cell nuclear antigen-like [Vigna unguiculata]|uniref:proliferating cell nuclear antigen-like n=1 Tax=Vigna unguiculata TaxID=3917 RepID=UPI0010169493|nr:proliferating cell nuclear antigen-like [Vigna unguiculata]
MVEACVVQGSILKKVIKITKKVVTDGANLVFSPAGFSLKATNRSLGATVAVVLPGDAFDHYHCDHTVAIALDLHCMSRIFHVTSDDEIITMQDCRGREDVTVLIETPCHGKISEFTIMKEISTDNPRQLHPLHMHHPIIETEILASLRMPSLVFSTICSELADSGDDVTIKIIEEKGKTVKFITKGELGTSMVVCRHNVDVDRVEEAIVIEMNETVSVTFSLRLINSFARGAESLSETVDINFLRDKPSVVEYKIAQTGYARFYLHPSKEH